MLRVNVTRMFPTAFKSMTLTQFLMTHVSLVNNTALAGEAIYGGMVDHCIIHTNITQNYTQDMQVKFSVWLSPVRLR